MDKGLDGSAQRERLARHLFGRIFKEDLERSHAPEYWYGEADKILSLLGLATEGSAAKPQQDPPVTSKFPPSEEKGKT